MTALLVQSEEIEDDSLIRELKCSLLRHKLDDDDHTSLKCFTFSPKDLRLNKAQLRTAISGFAPRTTPSCIIELLVKFTYQTFCIEQFLDDLESFHNQTNRLLWAHQRHFYKEDDQCFLNLWREKRMMQFDPNTREHIVSNASKCSAFPTAIKTALCSDAGRLLQRRLPDCWTVWIPEPNFLLEDKVRVSEELLVGMNPNSGNYIGIHCGQGMILQFESPSFRLMPASIERS